MNIIEFLDEVGHTKLVYQYLHDCVKGAKTVKGHTEVRFGTNQCQPGNVMSNDRVAVILWMDKADFERAQEKAKK